MKLTTGLLLGALALWGANELSNRRAPGFSLPDLKWNRYDLNDYRGKYVLIDFIRTDCPHCAKMSKSLEEANKRYGAKVQVLTVVMAHIDNPDKITAYQKQTGITTPILIDQGQMAASYFKATPSNPGFDTPHLFIVDPAGIIVKDFGGEVTPQSLFAILDPLVNPVKK